MYVCVFTNLCLHLPFSMCIQLSWTRWVNSFPIFCLLLSHCESISPSLHCSRIWQLWDYNETTVSWSRARSKAVTFIVCCVLSATTRPSSTHHFLPLLYSTRSWKVGWMAEWMNFLESFYSLHFSFLFFHPSVSLPRSIIFPFSFSSTFFSLCSCIVLLICYALSVCLFSLFLIWYSTNHPSLLRLFSVPHYFPVTLTLMGSFFPITHSSKLCSSFLLSSFLLSSLFLSSVCLCVYFKCFSAGMRMLHLYARGCLNNVLL